MPRPRPTIDVQALLADEKKQARRRWLSRICWGYVVLLLLYWMILFVWGDSWWPGTLLLYAPRWPAVLPVILLLLAAWDALRKIWLPLSIAGLIVLFPIMGYNIPFSSIVATSSDDPARLRLVTFNANGGKFRIAALNSYLRKVNADIVVCQEWHVEGERPELWKEGWHVKEDANAMLIASKHPIAKSHLITDAELHARGFVAAYDLNTPLGPVCMVNLHLPTVRGQAGEMEEVLHGQLSSLKQINLICERRLYAAKYARDWIGSFSGPIILAGDFNMTVDSSIYGEAWSQYSNAFSKAGWGFGFTKWTRWHGVRIDQILFEKGWQCTQAVPGLDVGSDHLPLMAELVFTGGN